jgi:hypothetical protein
MHFNGHVAKTDMLPRHPDCHTILPCLTATICSTSCSASYRGWEEHQAYELLIAQLAAITRRHPYLHVFEQKP